MGENSPQRDADGRQRTAERAVDALWRGDEASQRLGMRVESCGPGRATVTMPVRPDMVNGHRICHGGLVFTLADSAFAFACNSYGDNTVAAGAQGAPASTRSRSRTSAARRSRCFADAATRSPGD
jgi:acyl-CoA thioesterase